MYEESVSPDITESIPAPLGAGTGDVASAYPVDFGWDVSIGGLGFRLRPSPQYPYRRATEPVSKQQFDASNEAGEQSLSSWWLRSQSSWHKGAGVKWYEPGAEQETANRFTTSQGVNPWTQGELTLLHDTDATATASPVYVNTLTLAGEAGFTTATATDVEWVDASGAADPVVTGTYTGITQPASSGGLLWIGHDGGITRVDVAGASEVLAYTAAGPCRVWWVKGRLLVAVGPSLYEVPLRSTTGGVVETDGTLMYTHPVASWQWTGVAETGAAVLASGYEAADSGVYRFRIEDDGAGNPVWTFAEQVAVLPPGELVECLGVYLGSFVVLGTTLGARVGAVSADGEVQYGPVTVETMQPVTAVTFRDRFAYVATTGGQPDGTSGCARIDLSGETEGRFPWAWDVSTKDTASVVSIATVGSTERVVIGTDTGYHVQSALTRVPVGWLATGQIRYRTVEPKVFRLFQLNAELNAGSVKITAETPDGVEHRVFTFTQDTGTNEQAAIGISRRPTNTHLTFRLYLRPPDDDSTGTPVVTGYQIKALPAPIPMELIQLPVSLFDTETDRYGVTWASDNGAFSRFLGLKALERAGAPVRLHDLRTGESVVGTVEGVEFQGEAPPDGPSANFGGVAVVTIRRV